MYKGDKLIDRYFQRPAAVPTAKGGLRYKVLTQEN